MAFTKEARLAKAAREEEAKAEVKPADDLPYVVMERDGKRTEVNKGKSVELMQALGWKVV